MFSGCSLGVAQLNFAKVFYESLASVHRNKILITYRSETWPKILRLAHELYVDLCTFDASFDFLVFFRCDCISLWSVGDFRDNFKCDAIPSPNLFWTICSTN